MESYKTKKRGGVKITDLIKTTWFGKIISRFGKTYRGYANAKDRIIFIENQIYKLNEIFTVKDFEINLIGNRFYGEEHCLLFYADILNLKIVQNFSFISI